MPFQVLSLDGELLVEEAIDLEYLFKEKRWDNKQKIKATKRRCWHAHKEDYEDKRQARNSTIHGRFVTARKKALYCGQKWDFTEEEWQALWIAAGWVSIPGSFTLSTAGSTQRPAYYLRGPNRHTNTYMARYDVSKPWNTGNCYIGFRGVPLSESPYHVNKE